MPNIAQELGMPATVIRLKLGMSQSAAADQHRVGGWGLTLKRAETHNYMGVPLHFPEKSRNA